MKMKYRRSVIVAAILLLFVMLFSELFILCESDHDCVGNDCSVCEVIAICENILCNILLIAVAALLSGIAFSCDVFCLFDIHNHNRFSTPVSLKVKLSD